MRDNPISFYRVGFYLSGNGGYMKGSHFVQSWGDPSEYEGNTNDVGADSMRVVYDAGDGAIRHIHRRIELNGPDTGDDPADDPLEIARSMGHDGDLAVLEIAPADLIAGAQRVDLESKRLVAIPRA